MRHRKAYSREYRKAQILNLFLADLQQTGDNSLSVSEIANRLDMTPGMHIRSIISELVEARHLITTTESYHGAVSKRVFYSLVDQFGNDVKPPKQARTINLVVRGVLQALPL